MIENKKNLCNEYDGSMYNPTVTVVTVVYNGVEYLEQTILSVLNQSYDNIEYIIIDGGSTDGTLDIIKKYEDDIGCWISEPDHGIYDAMNKGTSYANGEWINFMNGGDSFYDNTAVEKVFHQTFARDISVLYGSVMRIFSSKFKVLYAPKKLQEFYQGMPFIHQATFVKTEIQKQKRFDTRYNICADYDFMYRLYKEGYKFHFVPIVIANFDMNGVSQKNYWKPFLEMKRIVEEHESEKLDYYNGFFFIKLRIKEFIKSILPSNVVTLVRSLLAKKDKRYPNG